AFRVAADKGSLQLIEIRGRPQPQPVQEPLIARIDLHECHHDAFRGLAARTRVEQRVKSCEAAAKTSAGVKSVMQRRPSGQTRSWQGPQGTCFCRWMARA